jgi:uncharacterized protein (DUF1499 family)
MRGVMSSCGDTPVSASRLTVLRLAILGGALSGCSGARPRDLGLRAGVLRPCPDTPNCVSSETGTPETKRVAHFAAPGGAADLARLAGIVAAWPRTVVVSRSGDYLHAESTSLIMRFVDDVEFRYDSTARVIQVRSASRLGRSDLGVNRKRVEGMRRKWVAQVGATP